MAASNKKLAALSRLFSSSVIRELAGKGKSTTFARLTRAADLLPDPGDRVRDVFDSAFNILKQHGARDEYIYKAALTHRVLLGRHSLRTACMLTEFRAGESKADVAILNGTTTVFEIKSERDSLSRLARQLDNYRKVFASVIVIASDSHVDAVLSAAPPDVGVMSLSRRYYITTHREPNDEPGRICPATVFEALRTHEAAEILMDLGMNVPNVPNTLLRTKLRELFDKLSPQALHASMLKTLKRTRDLQPLADLVSSLPDSLHAAALSIPLRKRDHGRLVEAINAPITQALGWS